MLELFETGLKFCFILGEPESLWQHHENKPHGGCLLSTSLPYHLGIKSFENSWESMHTRPLWAKISGLKENTVRIYDLNMKLMT